jgi:hypothetical protein
MNVKIGTEAPIFLFWEYLFQIFGICLCSECVDTTPAATAPATTVVIALLIFFMSFRRIFSTLCRQVVFHNVPHFSRGGQKSGHKKYSVKSP